MKAPRFWYPPAGSDPWPGRLLAPLGGLYAQATARRLARTTPYRASIPVVCVGNATLGGTGKTPVALAIAQRLKAAGHRPVFVTRGYGGKARGPLFVDPDEHDADIVGDEALLLARAGTTILARDRAEGARLAEADGASVLILDDGLQNPGLAKDLSLIVVDGEAGFGNGRVFPAGPMREPVAAAAARAEAFVLINGAGPDLTSYGLPVIAGRLEPSLAAGALAGTRVVAFAGIGRPEKFFATLRELGAEIIAAHGFADHAVLSPPRLARLMAEAEATGARLATTEKDAARLGALAPPDLLVVPVTVRFDAAGEAALAALLPLVPDTALE